MVHTVFESPVGPLLLAGDAQALHVLAFGRGRSGTADPSWAPDASGILDPVKRELDAYFDGRLRDFRVPLAPRGTSFQQSVWSSLRGIPYGETISYGELARRAPSPVVELNRAVAVAYLDGPAAGLALVDRLAAAGALTGYYLMHATRADLLRRLGRRDEAAEAYRAALARVGTEPERAFLRRRLAEVSAGS